MENDEVKSSKIKYTYLAKGKYYRFRRGDMESALPGLPGSLEFKRKYEELLALSNMLQSPKKKRNEDCFDWLIDQFYNSAEFECLADNTKRDYRQSGKVVKMLLGEESYHLTTKKMIKAVRDSMVSKPFKADKVKRFISRLYAYAESEELVEDGFNPTRSIKRLRRPRGGFVPWSEDEIALMLSHATGVVRNLILLSLYTGQRPGDIIAMEWSQALGRSIRVVQIKTGELIDIPCHPVLKLELDVLRASLGGNPSGRIIMHRGKELGDTGYYYHLMKLINTIPNMPRRSPHGGRFAAAARLEAAGCTVEQVIAVLGHKTFQMAVMYLSRRREAQRAIDRMVAHELVVA